MEDDKSLQLKKLTLLAWAKTLLDKEMIDIRKYNKMVLLIEKLTA